MASSAKSEHDATAKILKSTVGFLAYPSYHFLSQFVVNSF